jgi:hypothetical protein
MDRKQLVRQYQDRRPTMGIFQVRNTASGKILIGASTDVPAMLNRQRAQLKLRAHGNRALQADWDALGEPAFTFEVLDSLPATDSPASDARADLELLEAMWLEKLTPWGDRGYHRAPDPSA